MCSPPRVAVAQYTLIAVTHHRDTAAPAILLHHILAWEDRKAFLCLILAKLVKINIFIIFREVTIMKYESLTTHNIYLNCRIADALQQQHGHITHYTVQ